MFFMFVININAQRYTITIDSLREHFLKEKPYDVYDYFQKRRAWFSKENYKHLYYDQEMKNGLLKWLDQDKVVDYEVEKHRKYYCNLRDENEDFFVMDYVKEKLKLNYDSIKNDTVLWKIYTDNAINFIAEKQKKMLINRKEKEKRDILPDRGVISFHTRVSYPESYVIIKDLWNQYDKPVIIGNYDFSPLFISIFSMNDPEAQSELDRVVKEYIQAKGNKNYSIALINCLERADNAYSLQKMIELLPIRAKVPGLSSREGTSYDPFDYRIYESIHNLFIFHSIDTTGLFDDINTMRKNKEKIIYSVNQLIQKKKQEEDYWMVNMPFYKGE